MLEFISNRKTISLCVINLCRFRFTTCLNSNIRYFDEKNIKNLQLQDIKVICLFWDGINGGDIYMKSIIAKSDALIVPFYVDIDTGRETEIDMYVPSICIRSMEEIERALKFISQMELSLNNSNLASISLEYEELKKVFSANSANKYIFKVIKTQLGKDYIERVKSELRNVNRLINKAVDKLLIIVNGEFSLFDIDFIVKVITYDFHGEILLAANCDAVNKEEGSIFILGAI